jgi:hypothetical protein
MAIPSAPRKAIAHFAIVGEGRNQGLTWGWA